MKARRSKQTPPAAFGVLSLLMALLIALTVSCSDDNSAGPDNTDTNTVTDIDGNVYQTIQIGSQRWMAENLAVTHYRNGDSIPNGSDSATWVNLNSGAWIVYNLDTAHLADYGLLYNWYAVSDSRNIAPTGWHVASDSDWMQLEMYLGMSQAQVDSMYLRGSDEGGKLKEADMSHWTDPNLGATDEVGFCARPGGMRDITDHFHSMGNVCYIWTATDGGSEYAMSRSLYNNNSGIYRENSYRRAGYSVRCVKD